MLLDGTALIANAIYIYLISVFASVLLASVVLIARGFVNRGRESQPSPEVKLHILESELVNGSKAKTQANSGSPKARSSHKLTTDSNSKSVEPRSLLTRWMSRKDPVTVVEEPPPPAVEQEPSSITINDSQNDTSSIEPPPSPPQRPSLKYSIEQLLNLNTDISQVPFEPNEIRLSLLLITSIHLPRSNIISKYSMDQEIELVQVLLNDPLSSSKCLGLFRLVCAGTSSEPYTNAQHFHGGFCDIMESIIDTLDIYSSSSLIPSLQLSLLEMAFTFLWEHWNWDQGFRLAMTAKLARDTVVSAGATAGTVTIQEAVAHDYVESGKSSEMVEYELTKHAEPVILSEMAVFRLFCNLYLGTPVMSKSIRNRCVFKLSGVFYCCASSTKCNSHVELSRLLSQALCSTERDSIKVFFYEVLLKLLQPHLFCCIEPEDLFSNASVIQKLIFQGLWTDQPQSVREKAADVVSVLSERFHEIVSWNKSMKFTHLSDEHGAGHAGAPGSWSTFK
ncbi:hypothetical protein OXX79_005420 [Metschnikowia pulcherrima]